MRLSLRSRAVVIVVVMALVFVIGVLTIVGAANRSGQNQMQESSARQAEMTSRNTARTTGAGRSPRLRFRRSRIRFSRAGT